MKLFKLLPAIVLIALFPLSSFSKETFAVKSNLLYDALLNANLGIEFPVAPRWSIDISGDYNGWKLSGGKQWRHWMVQPEARWWTRETFRGHFFAGHIFGGEFNVSGGGIRREGMAAGIGIGYGYAWRLSDRWGLEGEIAVGYAHARYTKYPCTECGRSLGDRVLNYVGPTKAALNLVYYFGGKPKPTAIVPGPEPIPVEAETEVKNMEQAIPQFRFIPVDVPHEKIRVERLSGLARIQFRANKSDIDTAVNGNSRELHDILAKLDSIKGDLGMNISSMTLKGYASPEGDYKSNEALAIRRTRALRDFIGENAGIPDSLIQVFSEAEDWPGLREAIAKSSLPDKDGLLSIADSRISPDMKEAAMRRHKSSWKIIADEMLPPLRRTEYTVNYEHRYAEQELKTLEEVNKAIAQGDADTAARLLVDIPSSPEADYARGIVAAMQGHYQEAEAWFLRAKERGVAEADDALIQLSF